jgi:hypothetical protein
MIVKTVRELAAFVRGELVEQHSCEFSHWAPRDSEGGGEIVAVSIICRLFGDPTAQGESIR